MSKMCLTECNPPDEEEKLWVRILRKIMEQAKWVKASEYRIWPGVQFPTELPWWKYTMIDAYLQGCNEAEVARLEK